MNEEGPQILKRGGVAPLSNNSRLRNFLHTFILTSGKFEQKTIHFLLVKVTIWNELRRLLYSRGNAEMSFITSVCEI